MGRPKNQSYAVSEKHKNNTLPVYGWDNEFGYQQNQVEAFRVTEKLVSNAEYMQFVEDKGYEKQEFWSEEGWKFIQYTGLKQPKFWVGKPHLGLALRLMLSETKTMPWDWPVEVNCLEANAYSRWISKRQGQDTRLPTEAEYYQMLHSIDF